MKISGSNDIKANGTSRVEAAFAWQDVERAPFTLFIQTSDTILIAAILAGWKNAQLWPMYRDWFGDLRAAVLQTPAGDATQPPLFVRPLASGAAIHNRVFC